MDTYIEGGDLAVNTQGYPRAAYGTEEAAQRAALILSTQKGNFIYDREFGTDWAAHNGSAGPNEHIMLIGREALEGRADHSVKDISLVFDTNHYVLSFTSVFGGEETHKEVRIREVI